MMKKFKILFILFILFIPSVVKAQWNDCAVGLVPGYKGWGCDLNDSVYGLSWHCIDPGLTSPDHHTMQQYQVLQPGKYNNNAILTIASEGLDAAAICTIRYLRSGGQDCANLKPHLYEAAIANSTQYLSRYGSGSLDSISINYNNSYLKEVEFDDKLVKDPKSSRMFSKKFSLHLELTGVPDGVSLNYNVSVSNSNVFKIIQENTSGSLDSALNAEIIVYTDSMLNNDFESVTLTVTVTASKQYNTILFAHRGGAQGFISQGPSETAYKNDIELSASFPVTKTCQYKIITDEKTGQQYPEYILHIVRKGTDRAEKQKVDAITYMSKGCCADVQPKFFNTKQKDGRDAIKYYKDNCMTKDLVSYENECGTDSCDGEKNYKSYSTSFVWQVSMDTLKKNVLNSTKFSDINRDNDKLKHYYDETLSNNKYCKVVTSEDNEIYFPTTAVATSGRFFVFQELNKKECDLTTLNYNSKTCFRQPYIHGKISLYVMTDYNSWKYDYNGAVSAQTQACGNTSGDDANHLQNSVACFEATKEVNTLLAAKSSCENTINNFTYNLEPKLTFYYEQEYYNGNKNTLITEEANMYATKTTDTPIKYWPNVTSEVTKKYNTEYKFESNAVYENTYEKTVYYRPELNSYSLLPSGEVKTRSFQSVSKTLENDLEVGYVYNVKVTSYEGVYNTWFDITNLGNGGENSNLHKMVIQEYKAASRKDYGNDESLMFKSQCKYCMEEGSFERQCSTCEELDAKFVFRNVALDDITPNVSSRDDGTNWVDEKGNAAKLLIKNTAGNNIAVANNTNNDKEMLSGNSKEVKVTTLESSDNKANVVQTADGYIYDDSTGTYLEYDITLTPDDMRLIKANNRKIDYATLNLCANNNTGSNTKSADEDYCFKCNQDGKECESTFIDAYGDQTVTLNTRQNKWKYYFYNPSTKNGEFITGTMASGKVLAALKKIQGNEDGRYPDPENQQGWINTYKNWP